MTVKIDDQGSYPYRCPFPECGYSSTHCEGYGGFVRQGNAWYCPKHAEYAATVLRQLGQ